MMNQTAMTRRQIHNQRLETPVSDNHNGCGMDSDFGGQYANRHITEEECKRVCKMFQCPESTTKLKPPGFGIEIPAYQLHGIWWMLTQQPLRDIEGRCLRDAMGLGKTAEVLSTFAIFAMIKANRAEVVSFLKDGAVTDGRQHLPRKQTGFSLQCPSQTMSPYPTECTCVKNGDPTKLRDACLPYLQSASSPLPPTLSRPCDSGRLSFSRS
ncbi:hypothetical protein GGR57DRAFT_332941 [Xylariaceae sp. FL1272]|nr:hypothetical protein GGR57DRAFT_332941 [Xylariaceae sp. FL1272]